MVVDEIHERTLESDVALVALKKCLLVNKQLRLILMSATVDADKISRSFNQAPVVSVSGRMFDVRAFYLDDALRACEWREEQASSGDGAIEFDLIANVIATIVKRNPIWGLSENDNGTILVFLPGTFPFVFMHD